MPLSAEEIELAQLDKHYFLVVTPPCHVSTKAIFTDPTLSSHYSPKQSKSAILQGPWRNDFTPIVQNKFAAIGHTLDRLVKYGHPAMSGTGASCFVAFTELSQAYQAQQECQDLVITPQGHIVEKNADSALRGQTLFSFVAPSVQLSPVHQALASCSLRKS